MVNRRKFRKYRGVKNPWRNTRRDKEFPWNSMFAWVLVIGLPIAVLFLSINLTFRAPQTYSYYFTKSNVIKEIPFKIQNEDITDVIVRYMQHRSDKFQLMENSEYKPNRVFNQRDAKTMKLLRISLDIMMAVAVIAAAISTYVYVRLYKRKEKELLRYRLADSRVLFGVMLVFGLTAVFISPVRKVLLRTFFGVRFPNEDVLVTVTEHGIFQYFSIFAAAISLVLMVLLWRLEKYFIGKRKLFRRDDYSD